MRIVWGLIEAFMGVVARLVSLVLLFVFLIVAIAGFGAMLSHDWIPAIVLLTLAGAISKAREVILIHF